jgi:4-carboxymuconolactone decarboxylase
VSQPEQEADGSSALLASPLLRASAPYTLAGYARFRRIVEQDGALPAALKALFVSVAASCKGYPQLAQRELARAHRLGMEWEQAGAAAAILSSVRGEGAALDFIALLEHEYPDRMVAATAMPVIEVGPDDARDNFLAYFGSMPPSLETLHQLLPLGADAYYLMREGTINGTALGPRYSELLLVTVLAADYSALSAVHMHGARKVGATEVEIAEALICSVLTSGLSAWVTGAAAMAERYFKSPA